MAVVVDRYVHRTGEHCASTALRNLLAHHGHELSEGMIFGLASGLGFFYLKDGGLSPTRMFHGRTPTLEADFGPNTGMDLVERAEPDDDAAWRDLRASLDAGEPVMLSTDTFYLGYHRTTSHFPGHRCVAVGYDDATGTVLIADRKFQDYQPCSFDELRRSRNAPDHPMPCENRHGVFGPVVAFGRPLREAILAALARNAKGMLEPDFDLPGSAGVAALRELARDLPGWKDAEDWSWCARFGYQVVVKRGAAGTFFRSLEADFLREAAEHVPEIGAAGLAEQMDGSAARWCDLAALLKEQSERETCDPGLFEGAGEIAAELADREERVFREARELVERL
ncbi:MAG: BtrH N-terminal domain-containing protein [Myxococcota bacterium]